MWPMLLDMRGFGDARSLINSWHDPSHRYLKRDNFLLYVCNKSHLFTSLGMCTDTKFHGNKKSFVNHLQIFIWVVLEDNLVDWVILLFGERNNIYLPYHVSVSFFTQIVINLLREHGIHCCLLHQALAVATLGKRCVPYVPRSRIYVSNLERRCQRFRIFKNFKLS